MGRLQWVQNAHDLEQSVLCSFVVNTKKNQVFQIREEYIVQWKWRSRRHDEYNQGKQKKVKQEETRFFFVHAKEKK